LTFLLWEGLDVSTDSHQQETSIMTTTFLVPDMTCGHCEKTVKQALDAVLPGVPVAVDLAQHRVSLEGGNATVAEAAIRDAGYSPQKLANA
jgi:copper chaperone